MTRIEREEQQIVMRVLGQAEVERLTGLIREEEKQIRNANEALAAGLINHRAFEQITKLSASSAAGYTASLKEQQQQLDRVNAAARGFNRNMIAMSYAVNDFASNNGNLAQKIMGVANNLPMMLAGIGPAGLGYALGAVLPVMALFSGQLSKLAEAISGNPDNSLAASLKKAQERFKELNATRLDRRADIEELDRLKDKLEDVTKAEAAFKAAQGTPGERDIAGRASKAIRETVGSDAVAAGLAADLVKNKDKSAIPQNLLDEQETVEKQLEHYQSVQRGAAKNGQKAQAEIAGLKVQDYQKALDNVSAQIQDATTKFAARRTGEAAAGDVGAIGQVKAATRRTPEAFDPLFRIEAGKLPGTPEEAAGIRDAERGSIENRKRDAALTRQSKIDAETLTARGEGFAGNIEQDTKRIPDLVKEMGATIGKDIEKAIKEAMDRGSTRGDARAIALSKADSATREAGLPDTIRGAVAGQLGQNAFDNATADLPPEVFDRPVKRPRTRADRFKLAQAKKSQMAQAREAQVREVRAERTMVRLKKQQASHRKQNDTPDNVKLPPKEFNGGKAPPKVGVKSSRFVGPPAPPRPNSAEVLAKARGPQPKRPNSAEALAKLRGPAAKRPSSRFVGPPKPQKNSLEQLREKQAAGGGGKAPGPQASADPVEQLIKSQADVISQLQGQILRTDRLAAAAAQSNQGQAGMMRDLAAARRSQSYTSLA